jgi:hypothetical protein
VQEPHHVRIGITASPLASPQNFSLHVARLSSYEVVAFVDKVVNTSKLPRQHKLRISRRYAGALKGENVSALPIDELSRASDLCTDGCQIRHRSPSKSHE